VRLDCSRLVSAAVDGVAHHALDVARSASRAFDVVVGVDSTCITVPSGAQVRAHGSAGRQASAPPTDIVSRASAATNAMYSSTFIFAPKQFDDRFHRMDQEIATGPKNLGAWRRDVGEHHHRHGFNVYCWTAWKRCSSWSATSGTWRRVGAGHCCPATSSSSLRCCRTYGDTRLAHLLPIAATPPAG